MDGVQGGQSNDIFGQIMGVIGDILNPIQGISKLIGKIVDACQQGDSVSQSQAQGGTAGGTTTEMYEPPTYPGYVQGKKKDDDEDMARTLELVEKNWDLFDGANGKAAKDGKVSMHELTMIMNDKSQPQEVRDAARKIAESPWLLSKLDTASPGAKADGNFSLEDVRAMRKTLEATPAQGSGSPAQNAPQVQGKEGTTPQQTEGSPEQLGDDPVLNDPNSPTIEQSQSPLTSVLDDPNITFEAKTNIVLNEAMNSVEGDAIGAYHEWVAAIEAQENPNLTPAEKEALEKRESRLLVQYQRQMQKRTEMFQLLTNINDMSHDMAMAAIRNMKD